MLKQATEERKVIKVILFDGVCNLCSGFVQFVIRRDPAFQFQFASLQSDVGRNLIIKSNIDTKNLDSIILIDGDSHYVKSGAVLRICGQFSALWSMALLAIAIPRPIRDAVYDIVARNRHRWFGMSDSCMVPTTENRKRFL